MYSATGHGVFIHNYLHTNINSCQFPNTIHTRVILQKYPVLFIFHMYRDVSISTQDAQPQ